MYFGVSGTYTLTVLDALVALLGIETLLALLGLWPHIKGRRIRFAVQLAVLTWLALLVATIGGLITLGSDVLAQGVIIFARRWGEYSLLPLAACLFVSKKTMRYLAYSIFGVAILTSLSAFVPEFSRAVISATGAGVFYGGEARAIGLLFNPNVYGSFSVLIINCLIALLLMHSSRSAIRKWLLMFLLLACLGSLMLSGSRSALVGFAASLIFWGGWAIRGRRPAVLTRWVRIVLCLAVAAVIVTMFSSRGRILFERIKIVVEEGTSTYNIAGRIEAQNIGYRIFVDHPFGIGVGNIGVLGNEYLREYGIGILREFGGTDSQYLDALIEGGGLGLLLLLALIWILYRRGSRSNTAWSASMGGSIVALAAAGLFAHSFYAPPLAAMTWLLVCMGEVERQYELGCTIKKTEHA
ncbi:O-antigen ligase family protein [Candidatus Bipolaricaulota bacterium]